jgi:hypothetical protein
MLEKPSPEFLVIYCLIKSLEAYKGLMFCLNEENAFLILLPLFVKCCKTYLRSKNTPLMFKELNVINYLCTPPC